MLFFRSNAYLIIPPLIISYLFGGHLNSELYGFSGLLPQELILFITFFFTIFLSAIRNNKLFFFITWGDKVFFFFYITIYLIPWLFNLYDFLKDRDIFIVRQLLPIKIWIVYRIFYYIYTVSKNKLEILSKMFNITLITYVYGMVVSGIIGTLRLIYTAVITEYINITWPFVSALQGNFTRMQGTVGGINGGGILFAISAIFSLYLYTVERKTVFLYIFPIIMFFLLFTASFSSVAIFLIMFIYLIYKSMYFKIEKILWVGVFSLFIGSFLLLNNQINTTLSTTMENRLESQLGGNDDNITPNSFKFRIGLWTQYAEYFAEKPFFGYGYKTNSANFIEKNHRNLISENYFVETLLYGGVFSFFSFLWFYYYISNKARNIYYFVEKRKIIIAILLGIFISQISNMTLMYGGITELFGILIFFIQSFYFSKKLTINQLNSLE